ncbi:MAG TPA: hypothetical protein VFW19_02305 [Allosphingosinicella sp.]|nr:hypothetical protein [Allosphingosinicella sp.]
MTPRDNDDLWRNRFIIVNLVRIGGAALALLGCAIWYTDLLIPQGSTVIGLPLALIGLVVSFQGPIWLSRHWKRQDGR